MWEDNPAKLGRQVGNPNYFYDRFHSTRLLKREVELETLLGKQNYLVRVAHPTQLLGAQLGSKVGNQNYSVGRTLLCYAKVIRLRLRLYKLIAFVLGGSLFAMPG